MCCETSSLVTYIPSCTFIQDLNAAMLYNSVVKGAKLYTADDIKCSKMTLFNDQQRCNVGIIFLIFLGSQRETPSKILEIDVEVFLADILSLSTF